MGAKRNLGRAVREALGRKRQGRENISTRSRSSAPPLLSPPLPLLLSLLAAPHPCHCYIHWPHLRPLCLWYPNAHNSPSCGVHREPVGHFRALHTRDEHAVGHPEQAREEGGDSELSVLLFSPLPGATFVQGKTVSPEDYTTVWGWTSFRWIMPLLEKGTYNTLNEEDVWQLSPSMQARPLHIKFSKSTGKLFKRLWDANSLDLSVAAFDQEGERIWAHGPP